MHLETRPHPRRGFVRLDTSAGILYALGICVTLLLSCLSVELDDADHDGYSAGEGDCDDSQTQLYPGSGCGDSQEFQPDTEEDATDQDGDGYTVEGGDCNDTNADVYPGAVELPDGDDNDCNGLVDDMPDTPRPGDLVSDTPGPALPTSPTPTADQDGDGFTVEEGDCDDADPTTYPGAVEQEDDTDHDCDGLPQPGDFDTTPPPGDADHDGFTSEEGDCDDADPTIYPNADEVYDGLDNDCNGIVDDGPEIDTPRRDEDGDGFTPEEGDCDDTNPTVYPNADEVYDDMDNDCNGLIDEAGMVIVGDTNVDDDGDGYAEVDGDCDDSDETNYPVKTLTTGESPDCTRDPDPPENGLQDQDQDGVDILSGDCNDYNNTIYPGATEQCNGIDDNCNGEVDEGLSFGTYYADRDGDGYGTTSVVQIDCNARPDGFAYQDGDCNDADPAINPGATEWCNGIDDNCNGEVDEASAVDATTWYADSDGDGYGNSEVATTACYAPTGYVTDGSDCDDSDADTYPGARETRDQKDNDCNGEVDE